MTDSTQSTTIAAAVDKRGRGRRPAARKRLEASPWIVWGTRIFAFAVAMTMWQLFSTSRIINPFWFSSPKDVAKELADWTTSGVLTTNLAVTVEEAVLGFGLGVLGGIVFGLIFGSVPFIARVFDPLILALYSLPKIALAPLFVIWFGLYLEPKVVLAAVTVFFLVFFNTLTGVRYVNKELVDVVRVVGATRLQILRKVVIPSSLVWIFAGLRISIPYAMVGAITGELISSNRGIGYLIANSAGYFDTAGVFAGLVIVMLVTSGLNALLGVIQRNFLSWTLETTASNNAR